ncbi:MAG: YfiR family protein [Phycisphaerae bacterium]
MLRKQKAILFVVPALALVLEPGHGTPIHAQDVDKTKVLKVEAAYLYNFARFVQWPKRAFADKNAPFVIGVLGEDPFGRILDDTVRSKTVAGRGVTVRRFWWLRERDRAALKDCHVLYISRSEQHRLGEIVAALENVPVLVVSAMDAFARKGGMIGFVLDQGRIVFEINRSALLSARLKASSKLLRLARLVDGKGRKETRQRGSHRRP